MDKDEILRLLTQNNQTIRALGVQRLALFGSFVRNQASAESDVDLLVEFVPGHKTFDNFMGLATFLEDLLRRRVELVTPESLSPYIGPHILHEMTYVRFDDTVSPAYSHRDPVSPGPDTGVGTRDLSAR